MSNDRRTQVLSAIVRDYVETREPVGSRALVERYHLGVSPATIRNDMAFLEEAGFIAQPHTSAGRVPTERGYREFVDRISELRPLTGPERRAIETFLGGSVDLDQLLDRTARLLAQLTHQVAVIQYPSLHSSAVRHIELVPLAEHTVLVVVITENGRVEQRVVEIPEAIDDLPALRAVLNERFVGRRLSEMETALGAAEPGPVGEATLVRAVVSQLVEALRAESDSRLVMAGHANLARSHVDFTRSVVPVLDALEEQVVMLRLIGEMAATERVVVSIGSENEDDSLSEASIVSRGYGMEGDHGAGGALAVVGPTRMDYPGMMAAVHAVAGYVSHILQGR